MEVFIMKAKKLPSGNWNVLVFSHKDSSGKRIYESFTANTPEEAEYKAAQFKLDKKHNKKKKYNKLELTVNEAISAYIDSKDGILSPTTISAYKKIKENNVQGIMNIKLKNLDSTDIQKALNTESKKKSRQTGKSLSPKTIRNIYGLVRAAILMQYPKFDLDITLPKKQKKIIELPEADEIIKIIIGSSIELPCILAIWMSYSMSEIRGIKTSSITKKGEVTIKEVIVDVDGKSVQKDSTKAFDRTRKAKLPKYIFDLIKKQDTYQDYIKNNNDQHLITMNRQQIYDRLIRLQKNAGIEHPIGFHKLRHLNASVMLQLGIPDKYAMERGGWATNQTMKTVYQHTFSKERLLVDDRINAYFNGIVQDEMQDD